MVQMKLTLIRHGQTQGNLEKRYIGTTDEPLTQKGIFMLEKQAADHYYPEADLVITTGYRRCRQTAEILYHGIRTLTEEQLGEMQFGEFEYRNYQELSGNKAYQDWIDAGGSTAFPGGESRDAFEQRCAAAFESVIRRIIKENAAGETAGSAGSAAFVVHGGTIMALLHTFGIPQQEYFTYQCGNGEGYTADLYVKEGEKPRMMQIRKLEKKINGKQEKIQ